MADLPEEKELQRVSFIVHATRGVLRDQKTRRKAMALLLALAVLSYLSQQPMHPYELGRSLREHGDDRSIKFNHGSLYMVVGQLARAGFITEQETSRGGQRPERTVYALTDAGRDELRDWLRDLVAQPRHEYPAFVSALSLITALPRNRNTSTLYWPRITPAGTGTWARNSVSLRNSTPPGTSE